MMVNGSSGLCSNGPLPAPPTICTGHVDVRGVERGAIIGGGVGTAYTVGKWAFLGGVIGSVEPGGGTAAGALLGGLIDTAVTTAAGAGVDALGQKCGF